MTRYYPVNLDVTGKRCVVVGGGEVAERKVVLLEDCQAAVTVVSPGLTSCLKSMVEKGRVEHAARAFEPGDLDGAWLVIAATSDPAVNQAVFEEAGRRGILVNVVDDPARCNFTVPSLVRRGDLLISISTGGVAPGLSKRIRQELERQFGGEYEEYLVVLAAFRDKVRSHYADEADRRAAWERILDSNVLERIKRGELVDPEEFL